VNQNLGRLLVRLVIGGLFVGHGTQKLFGWFGGGGPEGTGKFFESIGLRPGKKHALAAGTAEAAGGALLAAGLATPVAAAALIGVMATAVKQVHWPKGPWVTSGGWEYNAVLIAVLFTLAERGPGKISLDEALGTTRCGTRWALFALGAGVGGAYLATRGGDQPAAPAEQPVKQAEPVAA
jgi:putative oxidoreductase